MNDLQQRLANMSSAKRELLMTVLKAKQRIGRDLVALLPTARMMSVDALRAEAVLAADIDPSRARPPAGGEPAAILLTGATGFLGAFLLSELFARTSARIYCLVRAADVVQARQRIGANLSTYLLPAVDERVVPVLGDLTLPSLGLHGSAFDRLADEVDVIYHCGAAVKWTYPYRALRAANVDGTRELLRLACSVRVKPVHFVSTVGVFSSPAYDHATVLETEALENSGPLYVGYAQTKWVAEKLVWLAGERGLPVSVHRPNTAPHSGTGAFNRNDHVSQMIRLCVELGAAPELTMGVDGAAIDYVAGAITELSRQPASLGKAFHLVNPTGVGWLELVDWLRRCGYAMDVMPYEAWKERLAARIGGSRTSLIASLSPLFTESILEKVRLPVFDTRNARNGLRNTGIACPPPQFERFERSIDYFVRTGYLRSA
jgi:thioester reductase-like protein